MKIGDVEEERKNFEMKMINIQGFTNCKYLEIHEQIQPRCMVCLTETQKKVDDIRVAQGVKILSSMREMEERKGGGIMILYREEENFYFEKKKQEHADCLDARGKIGKEEFNLSLVYLRTGNENEVIENNKTILRHLMRKAEEAEQRQQMYIAAGDFNGHLGYLGQQSENENGRWINNFIEESGLILMNIDAKCIGVYTWERGDTKSAIDFVLANERAYRSIQGMRIDEEREILDISDHCMIEVKMNIAREKTEKWREWKETYYYSTKEQKMDKYRKEIEERLHEITEPSMKQLNKIIKVAADKHLKSKSRRKINEEGVEEPLWMNEEIRKGIRERRRRNKEHRKCTNENNREISWIAYREQKEKVKNLISQSMRKFEEETAQEIRSKRGGREMWKMIDKLKGKCKEKKKDLKLFNENEEEICEEEYEEKVRQFWEGIYKKNRNRIQEEWNEEKQRKYREMLDRERAREEDTEELWLPKVGNHYSNVRVMRINIEKEDVCRVLKKMKAGKAGGTDNLKPEMYKELIKDESTVEYIGNAMQRVMEEGGEPENWKESRTIMLPKVRKPTVADLRPIALTTVSYKMMMKVVRDKLEKHLEENNMRRFEQAGFTDGGEILDNLLTLKFCVHQTYRRKEELVVIAVDFKKAYDLVKRERFLELLMKYKLPETLIGLIKRLYCGDVTQIEIGERRIEIEVENGIRQGCTASPLFFKLITYNIIEELRKKTEGIWIGGIRINSLFFADDGLLLAKSVEEAKIAIRSLMEIAGSYGLEINVRKSKCLMYNVESPVSEVEGLEVVTEVRYLGVIVESRKELFEKQKKQMLEKAKRLSKMTFSVIEKSCHKVIIGKAYWKSVVLPSVLFGMEVLDWKEAEICKLQRQENVTMRRILGAPNYAVIAAMRGEIGMGSMMSRIRRGRLQFIRRKMQGNNAMIRAVMREMRLSNTKWWRGVEQYMEWADISVDDLSNMKKEEMQRKVAKRVKVEWMEELERKSSLWLYRMCKREMREEDYTGGEEARIWFRARTNCLWLGERQVEKYGRRCPICEVDVVEDLMHLVLDCGELETERAGARILQRPRKENQEQVIGEFLFKEEDLGERKRAMVMMWRKRCRILTAKQ